MTAMPYRADDGAPRGDIEPLPGEDVVAAFDFDGTLTRGGSVWKFLSAVRGRPAVAVAAVRVLPQLVRAAVFGGPAADRAKEALFRRTLAGLRADEVARRSVEFGRSHYAARSRLKTRVRLDWHLRQGHRVVIVSASPEYYVGAVGEELGVDAVIATRLQVGPDGRLTGRFEGRNCRGEEKLSRLRAWIRATTPAPPEAPDPAAGGDERPFLWAYGNSAGDQRLLQAADIGVDAGRLGRLGKLRDFRRLADVLTAW